jgi:hypothetical protein
VNWEVISLPPSANGLLNKARVGGFSKVQVLVGILHWFCGSRLQDRVRMVQEYLALNDPPGPAAG